jgi:uncharacterized protein (DUF1810 family)
LLLQAADVSAKDVFGEIDAMKLRSCLTLFETVSPQTPFFEDCLERYFDGDRDRLTIELLSN